MSTLPNNIDSIPPIKSDQDSPLLVKLLSGNKSSNNSLLQPAKAPSVQTTNTSLPLLQQQQQQHRNDVLSPEETFDEDFESNTFESLDTRIPISTPQDMNNGVRKPVQNQTLEQTKKNEPSIEESSSMMMSLESSVDPSAIMNKGDYVESAES